MPRRRSATILPFRRPRRLPARRPGKGGGWFTAVLIALPLATFAAVFLWQGPPPVAAQGLFSSSPSGADRESARFTRCDGPVRTSCVVDGDTFWYEGTKIRVADINAPELSDPQCASEAALAERATERLTRLLNAGPFSLEPVDREEDKYGRTLRVVRRDGRSLGGQLVAEGLAERWKGKRREWC